MKAFAFISRTPLHALAAIAPVVLAMVTAAEASPNDTSVADPSSNGGQWSDAFDLGIIAINASLLQNGKILFWQFEVGSSGGSLAKLWDPSGTITDVSVPYNRDVFCGGQLHLADGRLMTFGGVVWHEAGSEIGVKQTDFFDVTTNTWSPGPEMSYARWYPTVIENSDGTILIFGGQEQDEVLVSAVEQYDPVTNTITTLPSTADKVSGVYPRTVLLPSGQIFMAGQGQETDLLDPTTSTWSYVGDFNYGPRTNGLAVLLPGLNQVLAMGGGGAEGFNSTATAEIIDFSGPTPTWSYTASMNYPRGNANSVLLADGTVFVIGGCEVGKDGSPVNAAEVFNPATQTWKLVATPAMPKVHHSTAILLPDGRVWSAGGDSYIPMPTYGQIFSPPYLFKGTRPVISEAPTSLGYGQSFSITTPHAGHISRVALMKLGTATHAGNFEQRYVALTFQQQTGGLLATAPASGSEAPPGWYMLFIINQAGVPSIAPMVLLN